MSGAREKILAAAGKFRPVAVKIEDTGETLHVRPMSVGGVARFQEAHAIDPKRGPRVMIVECLCDESGVRVLTAADEDLIAEWPVTTIGILADAITKATGLGDDKAAGDAAGN